MDASLTCAKSTCAGKVDAQFDLTERVYKVVWHKSISAQIRQLILSGFGFRVPGGHPFGVLERVGSRAVPRLTP